MGVLDELEFLGSVATGTIAEPISGVVGLANLAATGDLSRATRAIEGTQGALTYQGGQDSRLRQALMPLFEAVSGAADRYDTLASQATEQYGAPAAAGAALLKGALASSPVKGGAVIREGILADAARARAARPMATEGYQNVYAYAGPEQRRLEELGASLEAEIPGLRFQAPPPMTYGPMNLPARDASKINRPAGIQRAVQKAAERGGTVEDLTDIVRGSFIAPTPAAADAVADRLRASYPSFVDEGWRQLPGGYADRPLKLGLPSGHMAEMQLHLPGMFEAKEMRGGHRLYEEARATSDPIRRAALEQEMTGLYSSVLDDLGPEWRGVLAQFGYEPRPPSFVTAPGAGGTRMLDRDLQSGQYVLMDVEPSAMLDAAPSFQSLRREGATVGDRLERARARLEAREPMDPPVIGLTPGERGVPIFEDGRHRTLAAEQLGMRRIPALVPIDSVDAMAARWGARRR